MANTRISYANKIQKELDKQTWNDARCPNVLRYGKAADKEIHKLRKIATAAQECYDGHISIYQLGLILKENP